MRYLIVVLITISAFFTIRAQSVTKEFNRTLLNESFVRLQGKWPQQSNIDNLFISQDEKYALWRKNKNTGFVIFPEAKKEYTVFECVVNFQFPKKPGKNANAGIVLQAQKDGSGAVVIQINKKGQYRIVRLTGNSLAENNKEKWVKHKNINPIDNEIMVKTYDKIYDLYINGGFVTTFTETDYSRGYIGLYIGSNSKANFSSLLIKTDDDNLDPDFANTGLFDEKKALSQIIVDLRKTIVKKEQLIEDLEEKLRNCATSSTDTACINERNQILSKLSEVQQELDKKQDELTAANDKIADLESFKKLIKTSEGGDAIIKLAQVNENKSREIESLKADNLNLQKKIEDKKNEIEALKQQLQNKDIEKANQTEIINNLISRIEEKDSLLNEYARQLENCSEADRIKKEKKRRKKGNSDAVKSDE